MRYRTTDSFAADFKRLKAEHKATFKKVVREKFAPACDRWAQAQAQRRAFVWPQSLRVDEMAGTAGVMEMTWSFASPDGRVTFHFVLEDGDWVCVWRRVGDHEPMTPPEPAPPGSTE